MLQKPKTKFGYARRIFALPVLFSVAFAYLVNAKNREIEETNISIQKAVSQIKKDTVRPEKIQQEQVADPIPELPKLKAKSAELQKELNQKSKELSKLKPETSAFDKKIEEINQLASEMGKIGDETSRLVDHYFKSPEWKNKMLALDNMKVELPDLSNLDIDVDFPDPPVPPDAPGTPPGAPKAPKAPRVFYFKNNNAVHFKDLSGKEKAEIRKAMKEARKAMKEGEKARIEGEKARIEGDRARIEGQKALLEGNLARAEGAKARIEGEKARAEGDRIRKENIRIRIDGDKIRKEVERARAEAEKRSFSFKDGTFIKVTNASPDVIVMNADFIKKDGNGNIAMNGVKNFRISGNDDVKYKYYIDGKEVSKNDVNSLDTSNISKVNVNTQKNGDFKQGEVRIETKK
ncbi:hypothetical protein OWR28_10085 [Chryseobacterium sp. 1B4]